MFFNCSMFLLSNAFQFYPETRIMVPDKLASLSPCRACLEQVAKGRHDGPHSALAAVTVKPFRGSMFGGWEETTYKCQTCSAIIEHTNDKNEFAPFWWFPESHR
jgi:hypothetical protein